MKERSVLIIEGFQCDFQYDNEHVYKILGILEENGIVFKGIGISSKDCDLKDSSAIIRHLLKVCETKCADALIAGLYNETSIEYTSLLRNRRITYGKFQRDESGCFIGREKSYRDGMLRRDFERPVTKYSCPIKIEAYSDLFEAVEATLISQRDNCTWQGIQCAIDCMVSVNEPKTFISLPINSDIVK